MSRYKNIIFEPCGKKLLFCYITNEMRKSRFS